MPRESHEVLTIRPFCRGIVQAIDDRLTGEWLPDVD